MYLHENLKWRYAVKKYSDRKVEQEKVDKIVEAINLSATSGGLQPYRVIVVENKELQKFLKEGSFNVQIEEASHLLVFASFEKITKKHIDDYIYLIAKERNVPVSSLEDLRKALENWHIHKSKEENSIWAARQAYIGLGTALVAAAELKVDSTPMEGFDSSKFDKTLNLKEKGLTSVVVLALGYRDPEKDWLEKLKKVRLPIDEFTNKISSPGLTALFDKSNSDDETKIRQVLTGLTTAWNNHHAKSFSEIFTNDADFTNVRGEYFHGKNEIEAHHEPVFSTRFKDSYLNITGTKTRFIKPDTAAVDALWEMKGIKGTDGKEASEKGLMNFILTRNNDQWLILVAHNIVLHN